MVIMSRTIEDEPWQHKGSRHTDQREATKVRGRLGDEGSRQTGPREIEQTVSIYPSIHPCSSCISKRNHPPTPGGIRSSMAVHKRIKIKNKKEK